MERIDQCRNNETVLERIDSTGKKTNARRRKFVLARWILVYVEQQC
jgi:hypothetical protein